MTVLGYLENLASDLNIAEKEKGSIQTSISALNSRLCKYFEDEIQGLIQFGSSTRNTMLPRKADSQSDIDYLVVFDSNYTPQAYLNKLKRFAEKYYSDSQYKQASPAVVLELNHLMFDLVPGKKGWFGGYKIPTPGDFTFEEWKTTEPLSLNEEINDMNKLSGYKLKQTIRILKYWNAKNNYVFTSFDLEQMIVEHSTSIGGNLKDFLYECIDIATYRPWGMPKKKKAKLRLLEEKGAFIKSMDEMGHPDESLRELEKLFPQIE